jgi:hypothetical protein
MKRRPALEDIFKQRFKQEMAQVSESQWTKDAETFYG